MDLSDCLFTEKNGAKKSFLRKTNRNEYIQGSQEKFGEIESQLTTTQDTTMLLVGYYSAKIAFVFTI